MKIRYFLQGMVFVIPLLFSSCNDVNHLSNENKSRVVCSIGKFESDNPSRTNIDPNNNFSIKWASEDIIGIFPREGYQEPFEIPASQANSSSATFDGGYWNIKKGLKYNAYYPFDKKNFDSAEMKERIPVSYIGQKQNGSSCDIGAFDYTYSKWAEASDEGIYFEFDHIGAIAVFSLKYPATTTYKTFTFSVDESVIPLTGTYDLTDAKVKDDANSVDEVAFVADEDSKSTSISLELTNCSGVAGEMGVFYMMLPPMDLSNNEVTLSLTSSAGTTCTYSIEKVMNVKKGKLYQRTGVPKESKVEGTINGWMEEENTGDAEEEVVIAKTITVETAGTLSTLITEEEKYKITSLTISGPLNGNDIQFIRNLTSYTTSEEERIDAIVKLDLSNARFIGEGSYKYINPIGNTTTITMMDNAIGEGMFRNCRYIQTIILPNDIIIINDYAFEYCTSLKSITLPNTVTSFGFCAFGDCSSLTSINIPTGMTEIGASSLSGCTSLKSISIPNNITSISTYAFSYSALTSITIPTNVKEIGEGAFYNCDNLMEIHCEAANPPTVDSKFTFEGIPTTCILYVPTGCAPNYEIGYWISFKYNTIEE